MHQTMWEPLGNGMEIRVSSVHRFGADALLLAYFAQPEPRDAVCDLGTGCGIIPFFWFREGRMANVTAVDIQQDAIDLVQQSAQKNGLTGYLRAVCADLRKLPDDTIKAPFDAVVCNPPYFAEGSGGQSGEKAIRVARHEMECTLQDVINAAKRLLRQGGCLSLCHRPERLCDCIEKMRAAGMEPKRLRFCHHRVDKEPFLVLISAQKGAKPGLKVQPPLFIKEQDETWSQEMQRIYYGQKRG